MRRTLGSISNAMGGGCKKEQVIWQVQCRERVNRRFGKLQTQSRPPDALPPPEGSITAQTLLVEALTGLSIANMARTGVAFYPLPLAKIY